MRKIPGKRECCTFSATLILAMLVVIIVGLFGRPDTSPHTAKAQTYKAQKKSIVETSANKIIVKPKKKVKKKRKLNITKKEIKLVALLTMAEAEGECELGKRLVIDTVLNRKDSKRFPNTIWGVIYAKTQFTSMWNGRVKEVSATKKVCKLVTEEVKSRTNRKVMYFTAHHYGRCGKPLFHVQNHYFSGLYSRRNKK